ncbi:MAG: DUF6662 family protein [Pseudobdellovibrionaceae bacterium]
MKFILSVLISLLTFSSALASEGMFGYIYTAETTPGGQWEYEQIQTFRSGKARGEYQALDVRFEMEYGLTDRLQSSVYLNTSYNKISNVYDPENTSTNLANTNEFNINGISFEFLYSALSPYKDGIGLAFYLEPEIALRDAETGQDKIERALEARLILQKNFLEDTLVTAFNLMLEPEWERIEGGTQKELWAEWSLGANYRIKENWFTGVEMRNHMEFPDFNAAHQEHSAYFFGPTVHYASEHYWWTLTAMPQIFGWPRGLGVSADGQKISDSSLHLGQHERYEVRFKFGIPFGEGEHKHVY